MVNMDKPPVNRGELGLSTEEIAWLKEVVAARRKQSQGWKPGYSLEGGRRRGS